MNFLAHIFLSFPHELLTVGNCFGDFVKGKNLALLPEKIQKGISLHRFIDQQTDQNIFFRQTVARLRQRQGAYAGVLADLFYDYFLSKNWHLFSEMPVDVFAKKVYEIFEKNHANLPLDWQKIAISMSNYNWLVHYGSRFGIEKSLEGIAKRATFENKIGAAWQDLETNYEELNADFLQFFPTIRQESYVWIEKNL